VVKMDVKEQMETTPKGYSAEFKARVALKALRDQKSTNEIAAKYGVHPNQVTTWKKQRLEELPQIFSDR